MESFTWIQQEWSRRTGHFIRGFRHWNPRMIYDLRVNIFTQLKVHRLERSTSLWLVYHKRYMLLFRPWMTGDLTVNIFTLLVMHGLDRCVS